MAGDWIKIRDDLPDDLEVIRMSGSLGIHQDTVVGKLIRFWTWVDRHMEDGHAAGVTNVFIDEYVRHAGFARALSDVGWLAYTNEGFDVPKFERHLSECAKRRGLAIERKRAERRQMSRSRRDKCTTRDERVENRLEPPNSPQGDRINWAEQKRIWNEDVAPLLGAKPIQKLEALKRKVKERLAQNPNFWIEIIAEARNLHPSHRGVYWLTFDFIVSKERSEKFLNGKYRQAYSQGNGKPADTYQSPSSRPAPTQEEVQEIIKRELNGK